MGLKRFAVFSDIASDPFCDLKQLNPCLSNEMILSFLVKTLEIG